jgi:hypothetical protein
LLSNGNSFAVTAAENASREPWVFRLQAAIQARG